MTPGAGQNQDALQLQALLVSHAYLYTLFNKLLGGTPDAAVLEALESDMTADVLDEFAADSPELKAFGGILAGLRQQDPSTLLDAVRDEYTRVLIGPANLPASPYESPYTGAHDMALFQENTVVVRREYREQGLQARRVQAVPDDHVALMCAFMAELGKRSLAMLRSGDFAGCAAGLRVQLSFAKRHLGHWLPIYAKSVRNSKAGAAAVLYPQLLEALATFVNADEAFLAESAFWVESQTGFDERFDAPAELAAAEVALAALESIRPFGIQDNELVSVD